MRDGAWFWPLEIHKKGVRSFEQQAIFLDGWVMVREWDFGRTSGVKTNCFMFPSPPYLPWP